ncbi:MAG: DnaJ domain-containing protein [Halofilum sp. (in: g-proteobacteria)]|nr:DnaJ domain-containing protein [Halofilum sp. (in: g-proteobacteria)]
MRHPHSHGPPSTEAGHGSWELPRTAARDHGRRSATRRRTEIERAYRKLARKYHPDVSSEPDAEDRFQEVQEA